MKHDFNTKLIRARLRSMVADRLYCMEAGKMVKTLDLLRICTELKKHLDFHKDHGYKAHVAIVRQHAAGIRKLAGTLGRKMELRENILSMVDELAPINHAA
jgi:hypothetical protein